MAGTNRNWCTGRKVPLEYLIETYQEFFRAHAVVFHGGDRFFPDVGQRRLVPRCDQRLYVMQVTYLGYVTGRLVRMRSSLEEIWLLFLWYPVCCLLLVRYAMSMRWWCSAIIYLRRSVDRFFRSLDESSGERTALKSPANISLEVWNIFFCSFMVSQSSA